jgi:predicted adenylyl cyclase CyaB
MREVELKSVVDDVDAARAAVERAGGKLEYEGRLIDLRYGDAGGQLLLQDHVLRLRVYVSEIGKNGFLDWKGPTQYEDGYKVREELSTPVADPDAMKQILENLGYSVVLEIERSIWQYRLEGAAVRFEVYPRMDSLVEVEGTPDSIESAIKAIGLDRAGFTSERLNEFMARYELRTGTRAALSRSELAGEYRYRSANA